MSVSYPQCNLIAKFFTKTLHKFYQTDSRIFEKRWSNFARYKPLHGFRMSYVEEGPCHTGHSPFAYFYEVRLAASATRHTESQPPVAAPNARPGIIHRPPARLSSPPTSAQLATSR